jgi:predicted secreted protein
MNSRVLLFAALLATVVPVARAEEPALPPQPVIAVSAAASASVANDRMRAWLRAEADNADPVAAAAAVNARMAAALARAKATAGVDAKTAGYSTYQVTEKGQPARWRVAQTIALESANFDALTQLVTRLQASDGMLLSGMQFALAEPTRRRIEDGLTQDAIRAWQARAQAAAQGFGYAGYRAGRVAIQTSDDGRPQPMMMRAQAAPMGAPPVVAEGGTTDVSVTVAGDAILEAAKLPTR